MKDFKIKCSFKGHENIEANIFCQECGIYMCNKCDKIHSGFFQNHHQNKFDKDFKDIFTGFCKVENHRIKLKYFCKDHSQLCCGLCITKIKGKGNGEHTNCNVCFIEDIKEEKKNKLKKNIKLLENLSKNIEESINHFKQIFEKINNNKEELKSKIQKLFTKIRDIINKREDEILLKVDNQFDELFFKEEMIKKSEKLPYKIKKYLEKGKKINDEWNDENKLNSLINDCINIEYNINEINIINKNIKKFDVIDTIIEFSPDENKTNDFINTIKSFGNIIHYKKKELEEEKINKINWNENIKMDKDLNEKIQNNIDWNENIIEDLDF